VTARRLLNYEETLLLAAAGWIDEHGHCKGASIDNKGQVCVMTALQMVTPCAAGADRAAEILRRHLSLYSIQDIPAWNDAPERTKEGVTATLRCAAVSKHSGHV
jgi:hypothetical protein